MKYEQHELSAAFPSMPEGDLQALAQDIKENGLHSPIVLYQGKVLDGWHRVGACSRAGVNIRAIEYKGKNPVAFVKSHNWHRRHMTESQKAMTQVRLSEWREPGRQNKSATVADLPPTSAEMASEAGVSERTIISAKAVEKNGTDILKAAVIEGEISVSKAASVAKKPKSEQAKALKDAKEPKPKKAKPVKPVDEWKAKYDALAEDYAELKENRDDLAGELKTCEAIRTSDVALEMKKLREHLKLCTRRRDELMANAAEMRKSLSYWKKQAEKLGWKSK